ncbi:MAG: zinc ribbon domain-containing protein [Treponema sp.]|nr:zinc ribbon domain-containing protein [Treponema sp.]
MTSVHVCHCCGRTIESDFLYCPWCGQARMQKKDSLDGVFEQLEVIQATDRNNRLSHMQDQLDQLEKELNTLVLSTEMHK